MWRVSRTAHVRECGASGVQCMAQLAVGGTTAPGAAPRPARQSPCEGTGKGRGDRRARAVFVVRCSRRYCAAQGAH